MATANKTNLITIKTEFLDRDRETHPPEHAPDINTFDQRDIELVAGTAMDHPAAHVVVCARGQEREVQPMDG